MKMEIHGKLHLFCCWQNPELRLINSDLKLELDISI